MSKIVLNPNSIYTNSQANFIVNRDAMYAFVRSVSALNDSVWGIQPTREQYNAGITLDDLQPLSANHSLCANVYFLNNNVDALKFFATKPFVVCKDGVAERDAVARNPLAVYLTPVTISADVQPHYSDDAISANDYYEWIYTLPPELSTWEEINNVYISAETDENFRLSDIAGGKWELIGSTSLTDEKISVLFADVYDTLNSISGSVLSGLSNEISAREALQLSTSQISAEVSNALTSIDNILNERLPALSNDLTGVVNAVSTDLNNALTAFEYAVETSAATLNDKIENTASALNDLADLINDELSNNINPKLSVLSGLVSAEVERVDEISGKLSVLETLETKDDAAAKLEAAKDYADSLSVNYDLSGTAEAAETRAKAYTDEKASKYLPLSGGTMGGNIIVQPTKYFETREDDGNDGYYSIRYTGTTIDTRGSSLDGILHFPNGSGTLALEENVQQSIDALSDEYVTKVELTASYPTRNQVAQAIDDLSDEYATKEELTAYAQLSDVPEVPTDLSAFVNSPGYITETETDSKLSDYLQLDGGTLGGNLTIQPGNKSTIFDGEKIYRKDGSSATRSYLFPTSGGTFALQNDLTGFASKVQNATEGNFAALNADGNLIDSSSKASDFEVSVIQDGLTYTVKQGTETVGTIEVVEDRFITSAMFDGTILVLSTNTGETISTDLSGLAKQYVGDDGSETRISVAVENNTISAVLLDKYVLESDISAHVKDGTLTIQQNGAFVQEFTANQGNDVTANIVLTGYAKTSDFNTLQGKVDGIDDKVDDLSNITIPGIQDQIDDIGGGIDNLSNIVNDLSGGAENLSDLYDELNGRVDNAEDVLDNLTDDLSTLSDDLDTLREKQEEDDDGRKREIEELCGYFDDLNGKQEEDRRDIDDLIDKVGDNNVDNIRNLAEQAESIANRAATDSDIALGRANTANNTAEAANTTATQALTSAQTAEQNATAAFTASTEAQTNATNAYNLAVLTDSKLSDYILVHRGEGYNTMLSNAAINGMTGSNVVIGSRNYYENLPPNYQTRGLTAYDFLQDDVPEPWLSVGGTYLDANAVTAVNLVAGLSDSPDGYSFGLSALSGVVTIRSPELAIDTSNLRVDSQGINIMQGHFAVGDILHVQHIGASQYVNIGGFVDIDSNGIRAATPVAIYSGLTANSISSEYIEFSDNSKISSAADLALTSQIPLSVSQLINDADYGKSLSTEAREIDYIPTTPGGNISGNVTINDIALKLNEILRLLRNDPPPPPPPKVLLSVNYEYVDLSAGEEPEVKLYLNDAEVSPGTVLEVPIETIVKMEAVVSSTSTVGFGRWISEEDSFQSHSSTIYIEASNDAMYTAQIAKYGTEANPFIVDSPQALDDLRASVNGERSARSSRNYAPGYGDSTKYYLQTADLDMSGYDWEGIGMKNGDAPDMSHTFQGTYNGDGHAINNLTFKYVSGGELMGLFRSAVGATIKNLTVRTNGFNVTKAEYDADVTSSSRGKFGGAVFVGTTINSLTIDNCVAEGNLGTDDVPCAHTCAGFIANMDFATVGSRSNIVISNSTNRTNIKSTRKAGGIIGFAMDNITLTNVRNEGSISRVVSTNPNRAGDATREDSVAGILAHGHNDAGDAHCIVYDMDNVSNVGTITVNSGWAYESQSGQIVGKWATNTGTASTAVDISIADDGVPLSRNAYCSIPSILLGVQDGNELKTVSSIVDGGEYVYLFKNGSSGTPTSLTLADDTAITVEIKFGDLPVIKDSLGTAITPTDLGNDRYRYSTKAA